MNFKPIGKLTVILIFLLVGLLTACNMSSASQDTSDVGNMEGGSAVPAMVDNVTVELRENQYYAVVNGNYPDPCTSISSVEQIVDGKIVTMTLLTDSPADLMCAAVLTPFTVDILLTTGGLLPDEYTVVVNEGPSATFLFGQ